MVICRYCDKPINSEDLVQTTGYWKVSGMGTQPKYDCHRACKLQGERQEAYDCQLIDRDCNDCVHFERGKHNKRFSNESLLDKSQYSIFTGNADADAREQMRYIADGLLVGSYDGRCLKFDKPTSGWPNHASGYPCFEHRLCVSNDPQFLVTIQPRRDTSHGHTVGVR